MAVFAPAVGRPSIRMVSIYSLGSLAGAALTTAALFLMAGITTALPATARTGAVAGAAALAIHLEFIGRASVLPQRRSLIPQEVVRRGVQRGAVQFGFEMGTGLRTFLPTPAAHFMAVLLVMVDPSASGAAAAAIGFGSTRALPLWLAWVCSGSRAVRLAATSRLQLTARLATVECAVLGALLAFSHV